MLTCLACLRAHMQTCLACLRTYVPTCLPCFRAHLPACLACFCAYEPTCLAFLFVHVPTCLVCFSCLRVYMLTCYNYKFSVICFPYIFVIVLSFACEIKPLYIPALFLTGEAFNRCYDRLCTIKWFDFCLSLTLSVIFEWLIKGEKWIIVFGS